MMRVAGFGRDAGKVARSRGFAFRTSATGNWLPVAPSYREGVWAWLEGQGLWPSAFIQALIQSGISVPKSGLSNALVTLVAGTNPLLEVTPAFMSPDAQI